MKYVFTILTIILSFSNLSAEKRWVQVNPPEADYEIFEFLKCIDSTNCFAMSDLNKYLLLYRSTDQGKTWTKALEKWDNREYGQMNLNNPDLYDENLIYLNYYDRIGLEITENGGKDFRFQLFNEPIGKTVWVNELSIFSDSISVLLTNDAIFHTNDNWYNFKKVSIPDSIDAFEPLYHLDSNNIVFRRADGYNLEFVKYDFVNERFDIWSKGDTVNKYYTHTNHITFVNDTLGYACGHQYTDSADRSRALIWKTTDQGRTWIKLMDKLFEPAEGLDQISFRTETHGIAVGGIRNILETTDGGETWFQHEPHPDMGIVVKTDWAGIYPLHASWGAGIFRLETVSKVEELSSNEKFKVYQSGDNLEIAINDPTHKKYIFELYSQTGQRLLTRSVGSAGGFLFEPVQLIDLSNGAYFYVITSNSGVEFSGKLVIVQ